MTVSKPKALLKGAYYGCRWCGGSGCLQCEAEKAKATKPGAFAGCAWCGGSGCSECEKERADKGRAEGVQP